MEGQGIHKQIVRKDENIEFIDFNRERWPDDMSVLLDRRYRVPLDGYDPGHPTINRIKINLDTSTIIIPRG